MNGGGIGGPGNSGNSGNRHFPGSFFRERREIIQKCREPGAGNSHFLSPGSRELAFLFITIIPNLIVQVALIITAVTYRLNMLYIDETASRLHTDECTDVQMPLTCLFRIYNKFISENNCGSGNAGNQTFFSGKSGNQVNSRKIFREFRELDPLSPPIRLAMVTSFHGCFTG